MKSRSLYAHAAVLFALTLAVPALASEDEAAKDTNRKVWRMTFPFQKEYKRPCILGILAT